MSGTDAQALEHVKYAIRQLHAVRSGMTFAIEDVLEDGDTIWARVRGPGAARGPLFGPPRGRPVEITLVDVAGSLGCAPVVCSPDPDRVLDRLAPMP